MHHHHPLRRDRQPAAPHPLTVLTVLTVLAVVAVLVLSLSGCDDRECVRGHYQSMLVNNVTTLVWVCDEYEDGGS